MERDILKKLKAWKSSAHRKPLVLKGARQVGKTWALKEFGRTQYQNLAYFSLENVAPGVPSEYAQFFERTNDPHRIAANLSLATGQPIEPGRTLIVFDEVQDCPAALGSLKYFCEDAPELHVAAAGSLLGVRLAREDSAFPVGKVHFEELRSLSFSEFLRASGRANLDEFCRQIDAIEPVPDVFESQLVEQLQRYFAVGGMPEAVARWAETGSFSEVDMVLADLLESYGHDFAKHGGASLFAKLSLVWQSLPAQLARENKKFVYGVVREGARAREYEDAIQWLVDAGLVLRVNRMKSPGLPLQAYDDGSSFKTYCLDVGLLRRLARLSPAVFGQREGIFREFKGAFAENFVLQELTAQLDVSPRYWANDKPRHEVDLVAQVENEVVPIEVKSGEVVSSPSLRYYARKYPSSTSLRVRLSMRNLRIDGDVLNIPLYLAGESVRLMALVERG